MSKSVSNNLQRGGTIKKIDLAKFFKKINVYIPAIGFIIALIALLVTGLNFYFGTKTTISAQILKPDVLPISDNRVHVSFLIRLQNTGSFDADNISVKITKISLAQAEPLLNWGATAYAQGIAINHKEASQIEYFINLGGPEAKFIIDQFNRQNKSSFPVVLDIIYTTRSAKTDFARQSYKIVSEFEINSFRLQKSDNQTFFSTHSFRINTNNPSTYRTPFQRDT